MNCLVEEIKPKAIARFMTKFSVGEASECWLYEGTIDSAGYGRISIQISGKRKNVGVHRLAFTISKGKIPEGLVIDHMCRKRSCVNPAHLRAVTLKVNLLENSLGVSAINKAKTHCPKGHTYTTVSNGDGDQLRVCKVCAAHRKKARYLRIKNEGQPKGSVKRRYIAGSEVMIVKEMISNGISQAKIALDLNLSVKTVQRIVAGKIKGVRKVG